MKDRLYHLCEAASLLDEVIFLAVPFPLVNTAWSSIVRTELHSSQTANPEEYCLDDINYCTLPLTQISAMLVS